MVNWKTIDELRKIFIQKYIKSNLQSELEKACSEEYELKRDYNGRQILELLQNVDDACEETKSKDDVVVTISYKENILEVGNTGTAFSAETIERLCLGRASEKSSKKIGNKGTGFRSLLNDAEWIELHSGKYAIRFSEEYAYELFNKYRNEPLIVNQLNNWKKDYALCFPVMNCPESIGFNSKEFDTLIRVKVKSENEQKETSIKKQLEQSFYKSLLFLPNITKIILETNSSQKEYSKITDNEEVLVEEKIDFEKTNKMEKYFVYSKKAFIDEKEVDLIIAVPKDKEYDFSKEKLYCYFPIRNFSTPIHALLHAPFTTNNSRDDVPDDNEQINRKIFIELLNFIKEVSEKIAKINNQDLSIKTVMPFQNNKLWSCNFFNLEDEYLNILASAKILPTVNQKLISISDNPKIFDYDFPNEFVDEDFKELLIHLDEENNQFIKKLARFIKYQNIEYQAKELSEKINKISLKTDIKIRVKLFLWWNDNYRSSDCLPRFLKDTNDDWLSLNSRVYLPTDGGVSVLPKELSWVKLCILNQAYVSEIILQIKKNKSFEWKKAYDESQSGGDKRTLATFSRDYFSIKFIEQSSHEQIISTINQQIEFKEESISFINWFFNNYGKNLKEGSELSKVKFRLPSRDNKVFPIDELYLGKEYDNPLADKLFNNTNIKPLAELNSIYNGNEKEEFILFLKKCGIQEFPRIKNEQSVLSNYLFKSFIAEKIVKDIRINYLYSNTIENFEILIKKLDTKEIVEWLSKDEKINNLIKSLETKSYARQQSNWYGKYFFSNAYIKFILNTTPWIELNGKRYAPCKIIKYEKIRDKIEGYFGISEQELTKYLGKDIVQNFRLDFKESIAQLSDDDIKSFLDKLPNFDSGEISRKVYLDIIKYKKGCFPTYSISNLKLLCKDGKFYTNSVIKYVDRKISKSEESNGHFIYIQPKQSTETIKNWLGVERYKTSLKLEKSILLNLSKQKEFDAEIKDIKISILCIIDSNKSNIGSLKRIEIIPCSEIEVLDLEQGNKKSLLEDYFFVENENTFYIKLPSDFSIPEIRQSYTFSQSIIEIFKQTLALSLENESSLIELLISKNSKEKMRKIEDLYGVDKWNYSYESLFDRDLTNEKVLIFFKENGLRTELFDKISKIDFTDELIENDFLILTQALKKISKDVIDLNEYCTNININLVPYFELEMKKLMDLNFEKYKIAIYNETKESKNYLCFLDKIEKYKNFDVAHLKFDNTIKLNLNEMLIKNFFELKMNYEDSINPDDIYNNNVNKIISTLSITHDDFDYFIQNNKEEKSSLYFEIQDSIFEKIQSFLQKDSSNESKKEQKNVNSSTIQTRLSKANPISYESTLKGGKTEKSKRDYENKNSQNNKAGKYAEEIAYNELKKSFKNLVWHSKYSKIPADRNNPPPNGVICDMWNHDSQNGNLYFEIKSATTELEMSINEYESMENNKENFEVVLVDRDRQEISRHKFAELEEFKQINGYKFIFKQEKLP